MNDIVYRNIASNRSGYVVAPAGCGKTEAIVRAVNTYGTGKQLILTHTNAGVGALKKRFKKFQVSSEKYHIETISGWALGWIKKYPTLSGYAGSLPLPENNQWPQIYTSATTLLSKNFIQWVIKNSYSGVIIDEYQDCTIPMHDLIKLIKSILPCRALGDPLQAIFGFNERLVDWNDVSSEFNEDFGHLNTPYRWINAENTPLGEWLINSRTNFLANQLPDFNNSPIIIENIDPAQKNTHILRLCLSLEGSLCVIGPKHGIFSQTLATMLSNIGLKWVEPNDLPKAKDCLTSIQASTTPALQAEAALTFINIAYAGLGSLKVFITNILKGTLRKPKGVRKLDLFHKYKTGYTHQLFLDILIFLSEEKIRCKRIESANTVKAALRNSIEENQTLLETFSTLIAERKYIGTYRPKRCFGTTLLLKGLEFDHTVIIYDETNLKDLYVALTRGCKSIYIVK